MPFFIHVACDRILTSFHSTSLLISIGCITCGLYVVLRRFFDILITGSSLCVFRSLPIAGSPANILLLTKHEWLISIHGSEVLCKSHDMGRRQQFWRL